MINNEIAEIARKQIYDETRTEKRWIYPSLSDWKIAKENTTQPRVVF